MDYKDEEEVFITALAESIKINNDILLLLVGGSLVCAISTFLLSFLIC